jgi:hypothetical protein
VESTPAVSTVPPAGIRALGSAADVEAGYTLDPRMTAMFVECSIDPNPRDSNPVNDRCGPVKLK